MRNVVNTTVSTATTVLLCMYVNGATFTLIMSFEDTGCPTSGKSIFYCMHSNRVNMITPHSLLFLFRQVGSDDTFYCKYTRYGGTTVQ